jgi:hypothetical protein
LYYILIAFTFQLFWGTFLQPGFANILPANATPFLECCLQFINPLLPEDLSGQFLIPQEMQSLAFSTNPTMKDRYAQGSLAFEERFT